MAKKDQIHSKVNQSQSIKISDEQIEIFARRLMPEIKRFFADEDIRREFEEWQRTQKHENAE